jgi:hypothetical protein
MPCSVSFPIKNAMFNSYVSHYQGLWIPWIFHTFSLGIFQDSLVAWLLWTVACLPGRAGAHATAAVVRVKRGEPARRHGAVLGISEKNKVLTLWLCQNSY